MAGVAQKPTIPCPIAAWAEETPEQIALRDATGGLTWRDWDARIRHREAILRDAGVVAGSRVALALPTGEEVLALLPALFRIGAVACPIDPGFPPAYRDALLQRLDCAHVFLQSPESATISHTTTATQPPRWNTAQPATIVFTSGSSGAPKAAVLSLGNHLAAARASNENVSLGPGDLWLLSLPLHHVAGFGVFFRCTVAGASIALPGTSTPAKAIRQLGATHASLVARQLSVLLEEEPIPALKAILLGGSAIPTELLDRAIAAGLPIHTSYGMTEMATQVTTTRPGAARAELESSGRPLLPGSIRIGENGAVQVNGPARFLGYWDGREIVCPCDKLGWFTTGDRGHFDTAGLLHIDGRSDLMFVAGGENIQPEEIERTLLRIPGVRRALVVPVPHDTFGATPVAFVDTAEALGVGTVQETLMRSLPKFKVPRYWFPWPASGGEMGLKIDRAWFVQHAARLVSEKSPDA